MITMNPIFRKLRPLIYLILVNLLPFVRAQLPDQLCLNNGTYTNNSAYQANLNVLLSNLSTNIDTTGFYNLSVGQSPDRVNGLALCRGDVLHDICLSCLKVLVTRIKELCPNNRQAMMWYDADRCMLRYSDTSFFGTVDVEPYSLLLSSTNSTNPGALMLELRGMIDDIRGLLFRRGDTRMKMAGGNRTTTHDTGMLFLLVQCTPDLSPGDCDTCLRSAASRVSSWSYGRVGSRIRLPSCNLRFEDIPFYDVPRVDVLLPQTVPSPEPQPPEQELPHSPQPQQAGNGDNSISTRPTRIIIIVVVSVVAILIIVLFIGCFIRKRNRTTSALESNAVDGISIVESLQYNFGLLKAATCDFSEDNKLGQGGFGVVYKGKLPDGKEIALKRLSKGSNQGDTEFRNEVMLLAKLRHRNLVSLLGYSLEGSEKLLVYEFVQNASLDAFIFDSTKRSFLDWNKRYKIVGGIVRGLIYLHEDSPLTIIHRDLKAGNILLDRDMNPKIADFGMARLFVPDETHAITCKIAGTYGYMAPEYALRGHFSVKSDVFSFGVLLLEIIAGQKSNLLRYGETEKDLLSHAWDNWRKGTSANLVDPLLNFGSSVPRDILRCIHIGLLCVQENAVNRPTMAMVITMLTNPSTDLSVPSRPAFYVHDDSETSPLQELNLGGDRISQNEMSITEFQAR